jgi:RNA polymerase sigma factor (TIGR02999 family)
LEPGSSAKLTELLRGWSGGDKSALAEIVNLTYSELRKFARQCLRVEHSERTIQATTLVHEAYLQLVDTPQVHWKDRAHFFAIVAKLMRRILIDHARARGCAKRGGGARRIDFEKALMVSGESDPEIVRLDEALRHLAEFDSRKAKVVEMRYFGGMTAERSRWRSVFHTRPSTATGTWQSLAPARDEQGGRPWTLNAGE